MDSKILISAKRLRKKIVAILKDVFTIIGIIVMLAEATSEIFGNTSIFVFYKNYIWWILGAIFLGCIYKNWDHLKFTVKVSDSSDVSITLQVCDALKNKKAIIIPTNTTFDTNMDDEFISKGSLQGQYQIKYFKNKLTDLDNKIVAGLEGKKYTTLYDGRETKKRRYPIGTVCRINEKGRRAYFLADSDINAKGFPINVDASEISKALVCLWESLAVEGNQESYVIPLLGTGKARAKDASRDEVVREIILTFLAATKDYKITESLTVCIHPKDYSKVDWDGLCEFLKYKSQYANTKPIFSKTIGVEEITPSMVILKDEEVGEEPVEEELENDMQSQSQKIDLSEKEKMILSILQGNEMKRSDIAVAMGLNMSETIRLLNNLQKRGLIRFYGSTEKKTYYIPLDGI